MHVPLMSWASGLRIEDTSVDRFTGRVCQKKKPLSWLVSCLRSQFEYFCNQSELHATSDHCAAIYFRQCALKCKLIKEERSITIFICFWGHNTVMSLMFLLLAIKLRKLHCSNKGESGTSVNYTSYRKKHPTYVYVSQQRLSNKGVK